MRECSIAHPETPQSVNAVALSLPVNADHNLSSWNVCAGLPRMRCCADSPWEHRLQTEGLLNPFLAHLLFADKPDAGFCIIHVI
jgi:hypothetical protein